MERSLLHSAACRETESVRERERESEGERGSEGARTKEEFEKAGDAKVVCVFIYANIDGRTGTPGPGFGGGATPGGMGRTPGFGATPAPAAWRPGTVFVYVRQRVSSFVNIGD